MRNRSLCALLLLLLGAPAWAQVPPVHFTSVEAYEAWKEQVAAETPVVAPPHPGGPQDGSAGTARDSVATCDCWVSPDASYTTINNSTQWNASGWGNGDDGSFGPVSLPFSFSLYGQNYTQAYININGSISFGTFVTTFNSSPFPMTGPALVAPFWADVDLRPAGPNLNLVQYKVTPTALYVNWTNVGYYSMQTDKLNSFQAIITDGNDPVVPGNANVSFCFGEMEWTTGSASGGSGGFFGTPATVGANKGDGINYIQFGRFDHPGTDYNGPFGAPGGIGWLTDKYFTFATDLTTGNLSPVVSGQSVCDSLTICTGVTTQLSVDFLSPEPAQTTTATSAAPTLSNYTTISATSGNTASITTEITATLADTGYHDVVFSGTDNGSPALTSDLHIVVHVVASPQLSPGTLAVCDDAGPADMLPLLGGTAPPGGAWTDPNGVAHNGFFDPITDPDGNYTYIVSSGGICEAIGIATLSSAPHAFAGHDTALAYCSWDYPGALFPLIPGGPQSGGSWTAPGGTPFNGMLDPGTATAGSYQYEIAGTGPCPNDTAFLNIAIPLAVDAGSDNSIALCRDAAPFSMRSRLNGTPDTTGVWTDVTGGTVPDLFDPATGTIGVYTYTVSAVLPCPDQSAVLTINLNEIPKAGLDSSLVICANGGNTPLFPLLGGTPDPGGHWLTPTGALLADGSMDPSLELSGDYRYVAIGPGTCAHLSDTAVINVHIDPLPVITFTADPDSGCSPLEVNFSNTTDPIYVGNSCVWDFGDGTAPVDACGLTTHTYAQPGWYHVKLRITTPQGCTDQLIVPGAVLVDPVPKADFTYTPNPASPGNNTVVFTALDPHATKHLWHFHDGTYQTSPQAVYTFPDKLADTYPLCLYVWDRYNCADTLCDTLSVIVPNLWVPNAFTPDGNGINDVFKPEMLDLDPADYRLLVYDRWGELLLDNTDVAKGWDGTSKGSPAPAGVYVYRILYRPLNSSDLQERFGTVSLQR